MSDGLSCRSSAGASGKRVLAWIERMPYAVVMTETTIARSNTFRYGWDGPIFAAAGIAEGDALVGIFHQEGRYRANRRPIRPSQALREAVRDGVAGLRSPMAQAMARTA